MAEIINESELLNVGGGYSGQCFVYVIQKGDCLSVLAQRFGTTVKTLCELNSIKNPNLIYPGEKVRVK